MVSKSVYYSILCKENSVCIQHLITAPVDSLCQHFSIALLLIQLKLQMFDFVLHVKIHIGSEYLLPK